MSKNTKPQIEFKEIKDADLEALKDAVEKHPIVDIIPSDNDENYMGKYTKKALDSLSCFMNRVAFLGTNLEYGEEAKLVNYTNMLCRLANEIKYIEECEEIDNDFCSLMYDSGEAVDFRNYFD